MDKSLEILKWFKDSGVNDYISGDLLNDTATIHNINDLDNLKSEIEAIECDLKNTATNMVFGDGNRKSRIVFVGEAPGAEEDKQGKPFVGQSGQLLSKAISAIGMSREDVYITNVIPWRPLGNRTPTNNEIRLFRPYLIRHIEIINPELVVCLGSSSAKAFLDKNIGISQIRGKIIANEDIFQSSNIKILATFHPAYLLRSPSQKKEFWRDFLFIASLLN